MLTSPVRCVGHKLEQNKFQLVKAFKIPKSYQFETGVEWDDEIWVYVRAKKEFRPPNVVRDKVLRRIYDPVCEERQFRRKYELEKSTSNQTLQKGHQINEVQNWMVVWGPDGFPFLCR